MSGLSNRTPPLADLVLAAIAVALVVAAMLAALTPVGLALALGTASLTASGGVGYALFLDPPETGS